ncbi:ARID DNA-binding domain-containing protein [Tanacetum coccineum]
MVNTNTFLENRWSRPCSSAYGLPNIWYQIKLGRPLRKKINRKQKCYKCRQRGHIIKNCPLKEKKQDEGTKKHDNTSVLMKGQESANLVNKELLTTKPTVSLKYPEWIHFSTKCMIKGTDQGHWDDIWYISNNTNMHLCSKLNLFCNIKESFAVNKLDDQMKFLFIYGIGEVKNGDQGYLIPGVHYAPEVTLNILSIEQLERQGFDIIYEDNTCRLSYMFSNPNDHKLNEDKLRVMQNEFLENYFDSLEKGDTTTGMKTDGMLSMDNDLIEIKGTTYSTKGKGKEYTCHASHQCDFVEIQAPNMEAANRKGKEKIESLWISTLKMQEKGSRLSHLQPISPTSKKENNEQKTYKDMIKRLMNSD